MILNVAKYRLAAPSMDSCLCISTVNFWENLYTAQLLCFDFSYCFWRSCWRYPSSGRYSNNNADTKLSNFLITNLWLLSAWCAAITAVRMFPSTLPLHRTESTIARKNISLWITHKYRTESQPVAVAVKALCNPPWARA